MSWLFTIFVFSAIFSTVSADPKKFRWCVIKDEVTKCNKFLKALPVLAKIAGVEITPSYVTGSTKEDCMIKIQNNEADLVSLNSGDVYTAGKTYKLVPIVAEDYGPTYGTSYYYGIIVARKNTDVTINTLKGKKSCHTGYRRTAGWNIPFGFLLNKQGKKVTSYDCDARFASSFFTESCVPGAPKLKGLENLCKLCPEGSDCAFSSSKNSYAGYHGAFKCMADNKGEIAFVKHVTTAEVLAYKKEFGNMSDFKYICPDGTSKVVTKDAYKSCNLGRRPSDAVVTRAGDNKDFVNVLLAASKYCQQNTTASNCSGFFIFESDRYAPGKTNLMFRDSTKKLVDVGNQNTYEKWLGEGFIRALGVSRGPRCSQVAPLKPASSLLVIVLIILAKAFL